MKDRERPIRVLITKIGLDGHDRGAKVLAMALRDAGLEVIYTGTGETAENILNTCVQEDVDVVGLSCLSGGHLYHFPKVADLLSANGMENVLVIGGGIIPEEDIPVLGEQGIRAVFGPQADIEEPIRFIRENVRRA